MSALCDVDMPFGLALKTLHYGMHLQQYCSGSVLYKLIKRKIAAVIEEV